MITDPFDHDLWQALRDGIRSDDFESIVELMCRNPDLLTLITAEGTCLHLAARKGRLKIAEHLIDLGADVNVHVDIDGSPLGRASANGHLAVVKLILERAPKLDLSKPNWNPLFSAIYGGHADVARFLLQAGIDPHIVYRSVTGKLKNALSYAHERGNGDIVDLLVNADCRLPIEGVDVAVNETEMKVEAPNCDDLLRQRIINHMRERFGPVDELALQEIVPVIADVRVSINVIRPNKQHPYLTLFTTGMSDRPMTVTQGQEGYQYAELVMFLPTSWPHPRDAGDDNNARWPLEWLRKIAYYPHLNETWLGQPVTIISSADPPEPLGPNTQQSCLLLIPDFRNLQPLKLEDGRTIHFFTVVPLYTEERDYELRHGMHTFFERFIERKVPVVVDIDRASFAADESGN